MLTLFRPAGLALLRAAAFPLRRADVVTLDDRDDGADLVGYLRGLTDDARFFEAVAVSSPSLARRLSEIRAGAVPPPADLRRAVVATSRYWLRMCGRPTPFGTMAGVAAARFGAPATRVRLGREHRRGVRPDMAWLIALVRSWEGQPDVLAGLRVVASGLCRVRGDRLVVPYLPDKVGTDEQVAELTVRNTAVVHAATGLAADVIGFAELAARLGERFPRATPARITRLLAELVGHEVLLTDLPPPLDATDPVAHVLDRLGTGAGGSDAVELRAIRAELAAYATRPMGDVEAWHALTRRMRRLRRTDHPVQVDLALDADVRLPAGVADEVARAAEALWLLSPRQALPAHLRDYHAEFLERYGSRLVPVTELLDPDAGMAAPAGYRVPPSPRPLPVRRPEPPDRLLAGLVQEAIMHGRPEIVLDEDLLARLGERAGTPPPSCELSVGLYAESAAAVDAGAYRLVVSQLFGSTQAGATFGRFAYLLSEHDRADLAALASACPPGDAVAAQLEFCSPHARGANVTQVPRWLPHRIPVATFADRAEPGVIGIEDLFVGADEDRLYLVSESLGRRVAPATFHMVHTGVAAPNVVHFLREVAASGVRSVRPWTWGALEALPYLPRVRYGRTVLSSARWRPDEPALRERGLGMAEWREGLERWRDRLRVPGRVYCTQADHRIPLDLTEPLHQRLLRHELGRDDRVVLAEEPAGGEYGAGWLGGHENELVVPLLRDGPPPAAAGPRRQRPERRPRVEHLPGGEWLYAVLYCSTDRQPEILATRLPALVECLREGVERWFFLRYRDPEPHLRLRFHGRPGALAALLPRLRDWAAELRAGGMCRRLALDTYEPELERYGGPDAMAAAETAFQADSEAACTLLRLVHGGRLDVDPVLLASANIVTLARAFLGDAERTVDWLAEAYRKGEHHRAFTASRRRAMRLVDPYLDPADPGAHAAYGGFEGQPGGADVLAAWARRAPAVASYAAALAALGEKATTEPGAALASLVHPQFNRFHGIDADAERRAVAIARGATQAHRNQRRFRR
ncbi:lantibiotic dehydratase [Pseudonocardia acaciae]|uniref:lantibiotic dehydratase n=1 Tax=Pseudonocardia acaciae TaxID=551276 RepID=UPI000685BB99|nr:lantibiotic dehydratase [Pseudonocardia acaciae]